MDAIKKKMQSMKVEKDAALDRADVCEQVTFLLIKVLRKTFFSSLDRRVEARNL